jgi:hypothetical protein
MDPETHGVKSQQADAGENEEFARRHSLLFTTWD